MKLIFGSDASAVNLKNHLEAYMKEKGYEIIERGLDEKGEPLAYYDAAVSVATAMQEGLATRAILMCGTGMGVALVANMHKGIRAALCESPFTAEKSRAINDANVLCMGEFIVGPVMAERMVDVFLATKHLDGMDCSTHEFLSEALGKIDKIEEGLCK